MGYVLCTAEKPSVAADIARVLGANKRCNGYYEGNGYRVTWAVGHLVGLAPPEDYGYISLADMWDRENPTNRQKALNELPLFPTAFKLIVLEPTKEQFEIMKTLMDDPQCDYIIDCGDAGAEGHILQWFIRVKAGCTKPVKRFIATSMTDEAINDAMNNLKNVEDYLPIIKGEFCKKKADWIMGMSMSRAESITYDAKVDVGRVQSPTLYFVVKRYLDVMNFKSKDFYGFKAEMQGGFNVYWQKDTQGFFPANSTDEEKRLVDKALAEKTASHLQQLGKGVITAFETKKRATDRPQLYDILELQKEGNRIFGYSAEQVLQTAQSLYEKHKITTYPRTDSRYITHDLEPLMAARVRDIAKHGKYTDICKQLLQAGLNIDKKIVDDSKVTDHHAILVTDKIGDYDLSSLSEIEMNVLNMIITRMLVSFSGKYKYQETILNITFENGIVMGATGKIPVEQGWKAVQKTLAGKSMDDEETSTHGEEEQQLFPNLAKGQVIAAEKINVVTKKTTPPKLHTEDTLLTAMQNAGATVEGGEILVGRGIGTQSTRGAIIKNLFDKGYITHYKEKSKYLVPTKQGMSVIKVLPSDLYSPKITADWENQIADIVDGKLSEKDFMDNFERFIREKINFVKANKITGVDFSVEKEIISVCPWCKSNMYKGEYEKDGKKIKSVYCSNKECKCSVRYNDFVFVGRTGKNFTTAQIKSLLKNGSIEATAKSKQGNPYKAIFSLQKNDKGYAQIECTLPKSVKIGSSGKSFRLA